MNAAYAINPSNGVDFAGAARLAPALRVAAHQDDSAPSLHAAAGLPLLQAVLDHVYFGVAVVGADQRVQFANQAALRECADHPLLRIDQGRLVLRQSCHQGDLLRALAGARGGRWSLLQFDGDDVRTTLAVLPLWRSPSSPDTPVLLVFGLRSPSKALAIEFYAQSCELTATETRVLHALSDGLTPRAIAHRHDVALSTVRTQLSAIRSRTGARSITELVRALASLPPITRGGLSAV